MSFLFKRNKHKNSKDGLGRHPSSGSCEHAANKLRKSTRRDSCRKPSSPSAASMVRRKTLATAATAASKPSADRGIADMVFDPYQYTELLLQAPAARNQLSGLCEELATTANELEEPPSTLINQSSFRRKEAESSSVPRASENCGVNAIAEGVTYSAISLSTANKMLGLTEDGVLVQPPETRVPPNSPVSLVQNRGEFGSLVGVTMDIMEGRISVS